MTRTIANMIPLVALLGALAVPNAVQAQPEAAASDKSIVVTERRPLSEDETLDMVRRAARPVDGQLARFYDPICPQVIGFDAPYEKMVVEEIAETVAMIGIEAGGEGCAANLFVVIVDDGREFVRELARQRPEVLVGLSPSELDELTTGAGAARAWSTAVPTNSLGAVAARPSSNSGSGAVNRGYGGASVSFGGDANVMRSYESSNVNPSVQQAIKTSWVVIDTEATLGKSLQQIADYAAMRGLAMVRPAELVAGADTILGLFDPGLEADPAQLTSFDLAYLTSLYRVPGRRWARSQVRYMAEAIARDSDQASP